MRKLTRRDFLKKIGLVTIAIPLLYAEECSTNQGSPTNQGKYELYFDGRNIKEVLSNALYIIRDKDLEKLAYDVKISKNLDDDKIAKLRGKLTVYLNLPEYYQKPMNIKFVVSRKDRTLNVFQIPQEILHKTYQLGLGKKGKNGTITPKLHSRIKEIVWKPAWYPTPNQRKKGKRPIRGGHPKNPLGSVAMRIEGTTYRFHATIKPYSIGKYLSDGCCRMYKKDAEELAKFLEYWCNGERDKRNKNVVHLKNPVDVSIY